MAKKIDINGLEHFKEKENAMIAGKPEATGTATATHAKDEYFYWKGTLHQATAAIAIGDTITLNTNVKTAVLTDDLCQLQTALNFTDDLIGSIHFWGIPSSYTPGSSSIGKRFVVTQNGNRYTFDNSGGSTTENSRYYRLNGGIAFLTSSGYNADTRLIHLEEGHKYRFRVKKISGSITTGASIYLSSSSNIVYNTAIALASIDNEVCIDFIADDIYVNIYVGQTSGVTATSFVLDISLQDLTSTSVIPVYYVSTTGNDKNVGDTPNTAKATVNAALSAGAKTICILAGKYTQTINLALCRWGSLEIKPYAKDGIVYFYGANSLITESATSVSGYTKVKSAPCSKTFNENRVFLFQDDVADESTVIADSDRYAVQNGRRTRCADTKIDICTSDNLSDALTEIENASGYKWFMDTDNSTIYFSCPETVSTAHAIRCGFDTSGLFSNGSKNLSLELSGLYVKYQPIKLENITNAILTDCHVANACGDGNFTFDSVENATFIRCEAERCYKGILGDGFNAHSEITGDVFAPQTTAMLIDCWSHDNVDDGASTHERSKCTIIGGLFEYNGLGSGITPASGAKFSCYNSVCQYNKQGFEITGNPTVEEGTIGTQLDCFDCVSKNNTAKGFEIGASEGFAHLVNCVAIDEAIGYAVTSGATVEAINCSTVNCTTAKSGTISVSNGTPLT